MRCITVHTEMSGIFITELHLLNEICYRALFPESKISHACKRVVFTPFKSLIAQLCVLLPPHFHRMCRSRSDHQHSRSVSVIRFKPHYTVTVLKSHTISRKEKCECMLVDMAVLLALAIVSDNIFWMPIPSVIFCEL